MTLVEDSLRALSAEGALAQAIDGFVPRPAQARMAAAVAAAIETRDCLIAEAGTGTGKTYAYLVPALQSGLRVILSTGTRALQDQLFHRDLPRVRAALGARLTSALLKGRANYLCLHRLGQADHDGGYPLRAHAADLARIRAWAGRTERGDIGEIDAVAEDSPLWPRVTSTSENCLGGECPNYAECFVVRARQQAQEADLVVVNHHLLLADLALRQEGFGEILPGAHAFVLDEAHQLPELAAQFFSETVSARQLDELGRDALGECAGVEGALALLQAPVQALGQCLRELRLALDPLPARGSWARLRAHSAADALTPLRDALATLAGMLDAQAERSPGLAACAARSSALRARLQGFLDATAMTDDGEPLDTDDSGDHDGEDAAGPFAGASVRWYELTARGWVFSRTPLDIAAPLAAFRTRSGAAWIHTSATLAVGGGFDHFARQLGIEEPSTLLEPSPFDYPRQALCYLPRGLPEPADRDYGEALIEALLPVLDASGGRAFLLFTSHRALRLAAAALEGRTAFPLFVQGSQPRSLLLEAFRASGNGVLLGAASFWEGVDVAGDALRVVAIDKLPFAAPDDPVLEARLEALRRAGGNPFRDWQLPAAVLALKQGAGRLIRTDQDRGVLVLCDPRLLSKSYGRVFLDSLPPFPRTRERAEVEAFLSAPGALAEPRAAGVSA